jgi:hypothetical protein
MLLGAFEPCAQAGIDCCGKASVEIICESLTMQDRQDLCDPERERRSGNGTDRSVKRARSPGGSMSSRLEIQVRTISEVTRFPRGSSNL